MKDLDGLAKVLVIEILRCAQNDSEGPQSQVLLQAENNKDDSVAYLDLAMDSTSVCASISSLKSAFSIFWRFRLKPSVSLQIYSW